MANRCGARYRSVPPTPRDTAPAVSICISAQAMRGTLRHGGAHGNTALQRRQRRAGRGRERRDGATARRRDPQRWPAATPSR